MLKQTNVACIPKHKREFCRDHHLTFLCSSLLQTDLCLNGKVKFGGKKFQIIILGLSHKVCCLLPSPSYCNMVYALRLTRSHLSLSLLLYFNERSAVKERARHACAPNTNDWGQVKVYSPLPTLTLGLVFFRVVFTFGLPCFLPLVSMTMGHCNASLEPPKYKEQKTQTQGARKSSRLQLCRPKFIVKSP